MSVSNMLLNGTSMMLAGRIVVYPNEKDITIIITQNLGMALLELGLIVELEE